jgi:hypothetical protein
MPDDIQIDAPVDDTPAYHNLEYANVDGVRRIMAWRPPERAAFMAHPRYSGIVLPKNLWKNHSLRPYTPSIYDQGENGSCTGHASAGGFGTAWSLAGFTPRRFSPCFVYGLINGGQDKGASVLDTLKVMRDIGICLESTVGPGDIWQRNWPQSARQEASRFKGIAFEAINSFDEMVSACMMNKVVVFGLFVGNRFMRPNPDGRTPKWDGVRGKTGHALYAAGVRFFDGEDSPRLEVPNSWSPGWGDRGWCYLDRSYVDNQLDFFEAYALDVVEADPQEAGPPEPTHEI